MSVHHLRDVPNLGVKRLAVAARALRGDKDEGFAPVFVDVVRYADQKGCDALLFALYTTEWSWQKVLSELNKLPGLRHLRSVFVEHLDPTAPQRTPARYCVYYRSGNQPWDVYATRQFFGKLKKTKRDKQERIDPFLAEARQLRNLGNCAVILCGETNILRYAQKTKKVTDPYEYLAAVSPDVTVFLNPIHDRMTRHEMTAKRRFLSRGKRWLISVWNRGRTYRDGKTRDGHKPPWLLFFDGQEFELAREKDFTPVRDASVQIGIVDIPPHK